MNQLQAKSAIAVQKVLDEKGLICKVVELSSSTRTAQDAAASIGCNVGQIVKSLIFKTQLTNKPVLILASGPNKVDEKVIEKHVGEKIIKADADFTRDITGFAIGGIPPIGHKQAIEFIFMDKDLLTFNDVWAAAGTPRAVFNVSSQDLAKLIDHAKIISLSGN
ncbi:MAG: YbaK/EbsC family protein [Candidatus Babeliales bacterium]